MRQNNIIYSHLIFCFNKAEWCGCFLYCNIYVKVPVHTTLRGVDSEAEHYVKSRTFILMHKSRKSFSVSAKNRDAHSKRAPAVIERCERTVSGLTMLWIRNFGGVLTPKDYPPPPPPMATPPMRVVVFRDKANTEICAIEGHISLACSGEIDKAKLGVPQAQQLALRAALHSAHGAWNSCK